MARFTQSGSGDGSGTPGPTGPQGPAGTDGSDGAQGDPGADAIWNYTGEYNGGASYAVGDIATYDGQLWYRYNSNGGNVGDTPSPGLWNLLAAKGVDGAQGEGIPAGGTTGQILAKVNSTNYNTEWIDNFAESTVYLVRNNTGSTILKGTLVSAIGAEPSGRIDIAPHETTGLQDSELRVMGMATANISSGVNGTVMSFGTLTGLDTRGTSASAIAVGDETWAEGDILYAHPTVDGKLTKVRPQHDLAVAFITVRHASSGQIAIRIVPGNHHLEWLHDVEIDSPTENEVLAFDITSGLWKNQTAAEAGLQALEDTGWISVTSFNNSFSGTSVAYRRINNVVYLRGRLSGGTAGQGAFFLPEGFRPLDIEVVIPTQQYGTANITYTSIGLDGNVIPNASSAWLSSMIFPVG
jgi:hypothetical protein